MTVPLLFVATAILVVAEPSKQGCAKTGHDHVMLQKSISTKSTAVAKESPIDATASPGSAGSPPDPPESHVAVHLQRRLASDPHAVHRAADAIGAGLKPEHHAHLEALRSNPTVAMLKTESQSVRAGNAMEEMLAFAAQASIDVQSQDFYLHAGQFVRGRFDHAIQLQQNPDWDPWMTDDAYASLGIAKDAASTVLEFAPPLGLPLVLGIGIFQMGCVLFDKPDYDAMRDEFSNAMRGVYDSVMSDVKEVVRDMWQALSVSRYSQKFAELRHKGSVLVEELQFMPTILATHGSGAAAGHEGHMMLVWLLMVHKDIGVLIAEMLGASVCLPATSPATADCRDWHQYCPVLSVLDLILLQAHLTLVMASLEPSWVVPLHQKLQNELSENLLVVETAKWACMEGVADSNAVQNVYAHIQRRIPALLQIQETVESGNSSGLVQGFFSDGNGEAARAKGWYWQPVADVLWNRVGQRLSFDARSVIQYSI